MLLKRTHPERGRSICRDRLGWDCAGGRHRVGRDCGGGDGHIHPLGSLGGRRRIICTNRTRWPPLRLPPLAMVAPASCGEPAGGRARRSAPLASHGCATHLLRSTCGSVCLRLGGCRSLCSGPRPHICRRRRCSLLLAFGAGRRSPLRRRRRRRLRCTGTGRLHPPTRRAVRRRDSWEWC